MGVTAYQITRHYTPEENILLSLFVGNKIIIYEQQFSISYDLVGSYRRKMFRPFGQTFSLHLWGKIRPKDEHTFLRITFHCSIHFIVHFKCILILFSSLNLNFQNKSN